MRAGEKRGKKFCWCCLLLSFLPPFSSLILWSLLMESRSDSFQVRRIRQSLIQAGKLFLQKMRTWDHLCKKFFFKLSNSIPCPKGPYKVSSAFWKPGGEGAIFHSPASPRGEKKLAKLCVGVVQVYNGGGGVSFSGPQKSCCCCAEKAKI